MNLDKIQEWIPLAIGIITFLGGTLAWYSGAVEKRYAAQRDFAHLRENQKQISQGVSDLFKEQDRRFDELERESTEIKSLIMNLLMRTGNDETMSAILRKNKH